MKAGWYKNDIGGRVIQSMQHGQKSYRRLTPTYNNVELKGDLPTTLLIASSMFSTIF